MQPSQGVDPIRLAAITASEADRGRAGNANMIFDVYSCVESVAWSALRLP